MSISARYLMKNLPCLPSQIRGHSCASRSVVLNYKENVMDQQKFNIENIREIHVLPYCHTDYAWTNIRSWHICRYIASFREVLDIMRENSEFTWIIDNVIHSLMPFLTCCPERADELKQRVREGRINIVNGGWSLARPTQIGEETYIRNLIAADKKFRELFGDDISIDCVFNADTAAGHSQLPQIIRQMGYKYYCFQRPETFLNKRKIPRQFRWYGDDGSDVVVSRGSYGGFLYAEYLRAGADADWEKKLEGYHHEELERNLLLHPTPILAQFQGCDDVLPFRNIYDQKINLTEFMHEWNNTQKARMKFSTLSCYFRTLEKEELPVHKGILDPYDLSYNLPKKGSRSFWSLRYAGDRLLTELESTCAVCASNGVVYPYEEISGYWQSLFEITGHAIEYTVECDHERLMNAVTGALRSAEELLHKKIGELSLLVGTGTDTEYLVLNTQGHAVTAFVPLYITSENGVREFTLTDTRDRNIEYQIIDVLGGDKPYSTFHYSSVKVIAKILLPPLSAETVKVHFGEKKMPVFNVITDPSRIREGNGTFSVTARAITAVFEKGEFVRLQNNSDKTVSTGDMPLMRLRFTKTPRSNSWLFDFTEVEEFDFMPEKCDIIHNGPLLYRYRVSGKIANSGAVIHYTVNDNDDTVYIETEIDNRESNGIYTVDFACENDTPIIADIPFGSQTLVPSEMTYASGIYDSIGEVTLEGQFSAKSWFAYNHGLKLAVIHKDCSSYSRFRADRGFISLILTQVMDIDVPEIEPSSMWVTRMDKSAFGCRGYHTFTFALTLYGGSPCSLTRKAHNLRHPVRSERSYVRTDKTPAESVFTAEESAPVIVTAFWREKGTFFIRFYECEGRNTVLKAYVAQNITKAEKTDLSGSRYENIPIANGNISMPVKAHEIVTVKLYDR